MKISLPLTGRQATLNHKSTISRIVIQLLDNPDHDLTNEKEHDLARVSREMNAFLHDVWIQIGDTEFNRSGLRNATDKLIDFLRIYEYNSTKALTN